MKVTLISVGATLSALKGFRISLVVDDGPWWRYDRERKHDMVGDLQDLLKLIACIDPLSLVEITLLSGIRHSEVVEDFYARYDVPRWGTPSLKIRSGPRGQEVDWAASELWTRLMSQQTGKCKSPNARLMLEGIEMLVGEGNPLDGGKHLIIAMSDGSSARRVGEIVDLMKTFESDSKESVHLAVLIYPRCKGVRNQKHVRTWRGFDWKHERVDVMEDYDNEVNLRTREKRGGVYTPGDHIVKALVGAVVVEVGAEKGIPRFAYTTLYLALGLGCCAAVLSAYGVYAAICARQAATAQRRAAEMVSRSGSLRNIAQLSPEIFTHWEAELHPQLSGAWGAAEGGPSPSPWVVVSSSDSSTDGADSSSTSSSFSTSVMALEVGAAVVRE